MNISKRQLRAIVSVLGLASVALSIASIFVAPGTFWNWGLLLVALACVFAARRMA